MEFGEENQLDDEEDSENDLTAENIVDQNDT